MLSPDGVVLNERCAATAAVEDGRQEIAAGCKTRNEDRSQSTTVAAAGSIESAATKYQNQPFKGRITVRNVSPSHYKKSSASRGRKNTISVDKRIYRVGRGSEAGGETGSREIAIGIYRQRSQIVDENAGVIGCLQPGGQTRDWYLLYCRRNSLYLTTRHGQAR